MHTLITDRYQLINDLLHLITATSGSNYISCNNSIITNWGDGLDGVLVDGNKSILQSLELEAIYKPQVQGDQENELEAVQKEYCENSFSASQHSNCELVFAYSPEEENKVDGYVTRNNTLTIGSITEYGSRVEIWINNTYMGIIDTTTLPTTACYQLEDNKVVSSTNTSTANSNVKVNGNQFIIGNLITKYGKYCDWSKDYNFTDLFTTLYINKGLSGNLYDSTGHRTNKFGNKAGENTAEGYPVQSYSVLLRTIDNAGSFSTPSDVVTIYHDNTSPSAPTISNNLPILTNNFEHTFSIYAEYKSDVVVMLSRLVNNQPTIEQVDLTYFTNNNSTGTNQTIYLGSSIHDDTNNNCLTTDATNPTRRVGTCTDGLYIISITAVDGAGNEGTTIHQVIELDTTAPYSPNLQAMIDYDQLAIVVNVNGELNTVSKLTGTITSLSGNTTGVLRLNIDNPSQWSRNYTFCDTLTDLAGNISQSGCVSITTPAMPPSITFCSGFSSLFESSIKNGADFSSVDTLTNYIKTSDYSECFTYRSSFMLGLVDKVVFNLQARTDFQTKFLNCVGNDNSVANVEKCVSSNITPSLEDFNFANNYLKNIKDIEAGFKSYTECLNTESKGKSVYKNVYELASYCMPDNIEYKPGTDLTQIGNMTDTQKREARSINTIELVRMSTYTNDKGETKNFADESMNAISSNIDYSKSNWLSKIAVNVAEGITYTSTFVANVAVTLANALVQYNPVVVLSDKYLGTNIGSTVNNSAMTARATFNSVAISFSSSMRYGTDFTNNFSKNYEITYAREYALWDKSVNGTNLQKLGYFSGGWLVVDTAQSISEFTKNLTVGTFKAITTGDLSQLKQALCPQAADSADCSAAIVANIALLAATGGISSATITFAKTVLKDALMLGLREALVTVLTQGVTRVASTISNISLTIRASIAITKASLKAIANEAVQLVKNNPELATKLGIAGAATATAVFALVDDNFARFIMNNIHEASAGLAMFTGSLDDISKNFAKNTGKGAIKSKPANISKAQSKIKNDINASIVDYEKRIGSVNAHGYRRHNENVTDQQLHYRANTGYTPDTKQFSPVDSTRFIDNADMHEVYRRADELIASGVENILLDIEFGRNVGIGYKIRSSVLQKTTSVRLIIKDGKVVSNYPKLK